MLDGEFTSDTVKTQILAAKSIPQVQRGYCCHGGSSGDSKLVAFAHGLPVFRRHVHGQLESTGGSGVDRVIDLGDFATAQFLNALLDEAIQAQGQRPLTLFAG